MRLLFVHNNFPAQFRNLAAALAGDARVRMAAIGSETASAMPSVALQRYAGVAPHAPAHSFSRRFDGETRRAEQVLYAATRLAHDGFIPDLILVHPGWGENLPLRAVFPEAKIAVYCEYYYRAEGGDVGFDPEFPSIGVDGAVALDCKNASTLLALASCDAALSPTRWQKSTFPRDFQHKIEVIHEGVDTDFFEPDPGAVLTRSDGQRLAATDEIVTYSARSLEPIRGFHSFMRAAPRVLEARPRAKIVVVGDEGVSYGVPPRKYPTWKAALLDELRGRIDESRVLFLGRLPYADYRRVLQISSAHVYLTYPFVLSWSLLEAMSTGCLVIGSDTAPVREMIDGDNGLLAPMFDPDALAKTIVGALADPEAHAIRRVRARQFVRDNFDARDVCTPKLIEWIGGLARARRIHEPGAFAFTPGVEALRASGR